MSKMTNPRKGYAPARFSLLKNDLEERLPLDLEERLPLDDECSLTRSLPLERRRLNIF